MCCITGVEAKCRSRKIHAFRCVSDCTLQSQEINQITWFLQLHTIFFSSREIYGKLLQKGEPTVEIKCPFGVEYDTSIIMSFKKNVVTGGFR